MPARPRVPSLGWGAGVWCWRFTVAFAPRAHKYGITVLVKTTLEIPDPLFRRAKARAAELGQSLKDFVTEAIRDKLARGTRGADADPPWMAGFGGLRRLSKETARIQRAIDAEFDVIEPEDRD